MFQTAFDDTVGACFHSGFQSIDNVAVSTDGPPPRDLTTEPQELTLFYHDMEIHLNDICFLSDDSFLFDEETAEDFRVRLTDIIRQMMYVSGETAEPSVETTNIIEGIVREQVVELVGHHSRTAGSRFNINRPSSNNAPTRRPVVDLGPSI